MNYFNGFGIQRRFAPQTATVLRHLLRVGEISGVEAQALYRVRSLTKRISEINEFFQIDAEFKKDATGQRYVRYSMPNDVRSTVREGQLALPAPMSAALAA